MHFASRNMITVGFCTWTLPQYQIIQSSLAKRTVQWQKVQNQKIKMQPVQRENIFFQLPLLPVLCASQSPRALQLLPPLLISCPSLCLFSSARCSMYVSVCEPAELPVCLHVSPSVRPDLAHLEWTKTFLKWPPSNKGFSSPRTFLLI